MNTDAMKLPWRRERAEAAVPRWDLDVVHALQGRDRFSVAASWSQIACSLWEFGEDELADQVLVMTEEDLGAVLRISAVYEDPGYPLPVETVKISHGHVRALAAIAYLEGSLRPLSRERRRPKKDRPGRFEPKPLDFDTDWRRITYAPIGGEPRSKELDARRYRQS